MECFLDHIVLNVEDDETMIDFYSNVLMLQTERLKEYREGKVPFASVRLNPDTVIDLFPKKLWQNSAHFPGGRETQNHFCITLSKENWAKIVSRIGNSSIYFEEGPVERWGAHGTGISVYLRDPERNLIELRYYEDYDADEECLLGS